MVSTIISEITFRNLVSLLQLQEEWNYIISGIGQLSLTKYFNKDDSLEIFISGHFHDKHDEPHNGKVPASRLAQE